ncbi:MAG: hypothetical protein ACYC35_16225 [Pirellulales bacterium]
MGEAIKKLNEVAGALSSDLLKWALVVLAIAVVFYAIVRTLRGRHAKPAMRMPHLELNISALGAAGPPPYGPVVEFHGVPVRVAAVVLAPTGRVRPIPPPHELPGLLDELVPGLGQILATHKPEIRRWPAQLSASGFVHGFFSQAKLPGDGGKGTRWCSVAGRFKFEGQWLMVALVLLAESPNNLGQEMIEEDGQWRSILRVTSRK